MTVRGFAAGRDVLTLKNWRLEVVDFGSRCIDKILATPIASAEAPQPDMPDGPG